MEDDDLIVTSYIDYEVTLFHCTCIPTAQRQKAAEVFRKTMNAIFETPQRVVEMQRDYNYLLNRYDGSPLPSSASDDDRQLVDNWESAYAAATAAAFVGWEIIPGAACFEIDFVDESGTCRY